MQCGVRSCPTRSLHTHCTPTTHSTATHTQDRYIDTICIDVTRLVQWGNGNAKPTEGLVDDLPCTSHGRDVRTSSTMTACHSHVATALFQTFVDPLQGFLSPMHHAHIHPSIHSSIWVASPPTHSSDPPHTGRLYNHPRRPWPHPHMDKKYTQESDALISSTQPTGRRIGKKTSDRYKRTHVYTRGWMDGGVDR